jgi:hypothetical protein
MHFCIQWSGCLRLEVRPGGGDQDDQAYPRLSRPFDFQRKVGKNFSVTCGLGEEYVNAISRLQVGFLGPLHVY